MQLIGRSFPNTNDDSTKVTGEFSQHLNPRSEGGVLRLSDNLFDESVAGVAPLGLLLLLPIVIIVAAGVVGPVVPLPF